MMVDQIIYLFIFSSIFQIFLSLYVYRKFLNPIFYFNLLFFLHNWSFSFGSVIYPESLLSWRADPSVSYESQSEVLLINLIGLWSLFLIFVAFTMKRRQYSQKNYTYFRNLSYFPILYFILTFVLFVNLYYSGALNLTYGIGQATTSSTAFSPINQILALRIIFASAFLILSDKKTRFMVFLIFLTEIIFSFIEGGRKPLMILVLSALIPSFDNSRMNLARSLTLTVTSLLLVYVILIIAFFRDTDLESSYFDRFTEANTNIVESGEAVTYLIINIANSEGVQNWTYQLVNEKELDLAFGRTYFQALVNMFLLRPFQGNIADWQAAYVFKYVAYPDQNNHGWDFSFTAEAILNWGPKFSFLSFIFLGLVSSFLFNRKDKNDLYKLLYYSMWPILFIGLRTDSTAIFRTTSFYLFVSFVSFFNFNELKLHFKKKHS
jgi:hypothetical protein